jgi:hypothetical protein
MNNEIETNEVEIESLGQEGEIAEPKQKREAAWLAYASALTAKAQALGLQAIEQRGFLNFKNEATGHRVAVAKQSKAVTRVDTTLSLLGQPFAYPLAEGKTNGKICCHTNADLETVSMVLDLLASTQDKVRPSARKPKAETAPAITE